MDKPFNRLTVIFEVVKVKLKKKSCRKVFFGSMFGFYAHFGLFTFIAADFIYGLLISGKYNKTDIKQRIYSIKKTRFVSLGNKR